MTSFDLTQEQLFLVLHPTGIRSGGLAGVGHRRERWKSSAIWLSPLCIYFVFLFAFYRIFKTNKFMETLSLYLYIYRKPNSNLTRIKHYRWKMIHIDRKMCEQPQLPLQLMWAKICFTLIFFKQIVLCAEKAVQPGLLWMSIWRLSSSIQIKLTSSLSRGTAQPSPIPCYLLSGTLKKLAIYETFIQV